MRQGIMLTVDYHDANCVIRRHDRDKRSEEVVTVPTTRGDLGQVVTEARRAAGRRPVVWIQESTTGWARVQALIGGRAEFVLANVLQMPLPPKGRRRKTDTIDTARMQREYLNGSLPRAHQPPAAWRAMRRVVARRESLVRRQTAVRNGINRYFAHETWESRAGWWTAKGRSQLRALAKALPPRDALVVMSQLDELDFVQGQLTAIATEFQALYDERPDARRLDAVKGISVVAAVAIVARIGPIDRFASAEQLIAYAGLAPGVHQSDQTRRSGRIGGGGTDKHLRHYLMEAAIWARTLPRYAATHAKVAKRRGKKIARLVVARMLVRSIVKVLRDGTAFDPDAPPPRPAAKANAATKTNAATAKANAARAKANANTVASAT
jgi:transposase